MLDKHITATKKYLYSMLNNNIRDVLASENKAVGLSQNRQVYHLIHALPRSIPLHLPYNRQPTILIRLSPFIVPVSLICPDAHRCIAVDPLKILL